ASTTPRPRRHPCRAWPPTPLERAGMPASGPSQQINVRLVRSGLAPSLRLSPARALKRLETGGDILHTPNFHHDHHQTERAGRRLDLAKIRQGDRIAGIGQNRQPAKRRDDLALRL